MEYQGIVRRGVKEIKYRGVYDIVSELVKIWGPKRPAGEILVTSVPMWKIKRMKRGYNQAEMIAREVARRWRVEYLEILVRNRETKPMYGLKKEERLDNVKGAFAQSPKLDPQNKTLILIDDVWTSGATMQECMRVLKRAGWKWVIPMALAR